MENRRARIEKASKARKREWFIEFIWRKKAILMKVQGHQRMVQSRIVAVRGAVALERARLRGQHAEPRPVSKRCEAAFASTTLTRNLIKFGSTRGR